MNRQGVRAWSRQAPAVDADKLVNVALQRPRTGPSLAIGQGDEGQIDAAVEAVQVPGPQDTGCIVRKRHLSELRQVSVTNHGVFVVATVMKAAAQVEADDVSLLVPA